MADGTEIRALSEKPVGGLTVGAVRADEIGVADLRLHPGTLERRSGAADRRLAVDVGVWYWPVRPAVFGVRVWTAVRWR